MSDAITTDTLVAGENVQSVNTDTEAETTVEAKSDAVSTPSVEVREGRMYVDGVRVYTRDESNRIASNAKKEAESKFLQDLEVDSFDKVKSVVNQLRNTDVEGGESLNVQGLRDAVKKREQTVEELRAELQNVRTDYALREHIGNLKDNMPTSWNAEQKSAVVDLMKARNMLHMEGDSFAIRNGDEFITTDGERPDYATAVKVVGQSLGLPFAKKGVDILEADRSIVSDTAKKGVDMDRTKSDPGYRAAYVSLRTQNATMQRSQITDKMVLDQMKKSGR